MYGEVWLHDPTDPTSTIFCGSAFVGTCPCPAAVPPSLNGLTISDENQTSIIPDDGRNASDLLESAPFTYVGGIFDDPYKYSPPGPSSITSYDPNILFAGVPYTYQYSDHNPLQFNFIIKENTGAANITSYDFQLVDISDSNYAIPLVFNSPYVGVLDPVAGSTQNYSSLSDCMSDLSTVTCVHKVNENIDSSDNTLLHVNILVYLKNGIRNTEYKLTSYLANASGASTQADVDLTTFGWPSSNLIVDTVAPLVSMEAYSLPGDQMRIVITVTDSNLATSPIPLFRSYAIAFNSVSGNRFLSTLNNITVNGTDFENSPFGSSNGYTVTSLGGGTYQFAIKLQGLLAGDNVYYGVCVYDRAGNISCRTDNPKQIGWNWLKTSLGNVYSHGTSAGGFVGFPDYREISGILESPVDSIVSPFNASSATISNFVVSSRDPSLSFLQWGYNGYYNVNEFGIDNQIINNTTNWYNFLHRLADNRCSSLSSCYSVTINNIDPLTLRNASEVLNYPLKLITIDGSSTGGLNIAIDTIRCRGGVVIFLKNVNLTVKDLRKVVANVNDIYNNVCLFVADSNSSITIDDDPNESLVGNDNLDVVEAGFIMTGNSLLRVKQTPYSSYVDGNGNYDRLIIHGFVYTEDTAPVFERDLGPTDNQTYPAEWIIYDGTILKLLNPLLGTQKIKTFNCGMSNNNVYCR